MPAPITSGPKKPKSGTPGKNSTTSGKPTDAPIINEEADRILGRMTLQTMGVFFLAIVAMTVLGIYVSQPHTPLFKYHRAVAFATSLISLVVFYWMNGRVYAKRLEIGRDLVAKREYRQAIASLNPFDAFGGRSLDTSGEAHYLLAQAYTATGNRARAEKCRQFVLKHRRGTWAEKLGGKPAASRTAAASAPQAAPAKPRPPKSKPKRRF